MSGESEKLRGSDCSDPLQTFGSSFHYRQPYVVSCRTGPVAFSQGSSLGDAALFFCGLKRKSDSVNENNAFTYYARLCDRGLAGSVRASVVCGLNSKVHNDNNSGPFENYANLCEKGILRASHVASANENSIDMCPQMRSPSPVAVSNIQPSNYVCVKDGVTDEGHIREWSDVAASFTNAGKEILLDFRESAFRLVPTERQMGKSLFGRTSIRDDFYGCMFQQLGSVEAQGQCSGTGTDATNVGLRYMAYTTQQYLSFQPSELCGVASTHPKRPYRNRNTNRNRTHCDDTNVRSYAYRDIGDCYLHCSHCGARFWFGERFKGHSGSRQPEYHLCCGRGSMYIEPPDYMKSLFSNSHFMDNVRAYNQMFAMTSFGARIDDAINNGAGPYVFKVSGQLLALLQAGDQLYSNTPYRLAFEWNRSCCRTQSHLPGLKLM